MLFGNRVIVIFGIWFVSGYSHVFNYLYCSQLSSSLSRAKVVEMDRICIFNRCSWLMNPGDFYCDLVNIADFLMDCFHCFLCVLRV